MKHLTYLLLSFLIFSMSSCAIIAGIFKAGIWTGIFIVVIVGLIIFLATRGGKRD
ncbi:hypothetical protein CLV51_104157 [Chitinophaga niastensis]|uniref:Phosphatidate cytidylyltransferase n=1 Tax=Chitinophaga niastensis TaxID=536980 RepID=A0A2P8HGW1_CHINA|nr:phosphatidate cytidylyltransferase [Chitinophaga niastensis]PSL45454.1 hypothetical protein CLV51_104157 [Chitinophaga niastensis]